ASNARIQALASRGDPRALRIAESEERLERFLGPLTSARIITASVLVLSFAYIGARTNGPSGTIGIGAIGALLTALVQMTVGLLVARRPEYAAVQLSRVIRWCALGFGVISWLLALPSRLIARSLRSVAPLPTDDLLALVEREEAAGGVEEQEQRMIRG